MRAATDPIHICGGKIIRTGEICWLPNGHRGQCEPRIPVYVSSGGSELIDLPIAGEFE